jgi:hypothetical protein
MGLTSPSWAPSTIWGYLQLYVALSLFVALPIAYAEDYDWNQYPEHSTTFYALPIALFTSALATILAKLNYYPIKKNNNVRTSLEWSLKQVHPSVKYKADPVENLNEIWNLETEAQDVEGKIAHYLLINIFQAHTYLANFQQRVAPQIDELLKKANYDVFFRELAINDEDEKAKYKTADDIFALFNGQVSMRLAQSIRLLPEHLRTDDDTTWGTLEQGLTKLTNVIKRASNIIMTQPGDSRPTSPASSVPVLPIGNNPAMSLDDLNRTLNKALGQQETTASLPLDNLGQAIEDRIARARICRHPEELAQEINQPANTPWATLLQEVRNMTNRMTTTCTHIAELNNVLHFNTNNQWTDALNYVESLLDFYNTNQSNGESSAKLFKQTDVPTFDGTKDQYWTWRSAFNLFRKTIQVRAQDLDQAVARVMNAFSGEARTIAMAWDPETIKGTDWQTTAEAILKYTDTHFMGPTEYFERLERWRKMRWTSHDQGQPFVSKFITEVQLINQIAETMKPQRAKIEHQEAMNVLLSKLPRNVVLTLQKDHNEGLTGNSMEQCNQVAREWEYHIKTQPKNITSAKPATLLAPAPMETTNVLKDRTCGLRSSYDSPSPAVPMEFRGRLYPGPTDTPEMVATITSRNRKAILGRICEACRRPQHQHHGRTQFKPIRPVNARIMPAPAPAPTTPAAPPTTLLD